MLMHMRYCLQAPIAAVDAATAPVAFPGGTIRGESVLDTLSVSQPLRIPTVFAPFHAGTVFSLEARDVPPGTSLTFSNMTLLLPNVTYESIYESGFTDFFDMAGSARVCFTNRCAIRTHARHDGAKHTMQAIAAPDGPTNLTYDSAWIARRRDTIHRTTCMSVGRYRVSGCSGLLPSGLPGCACVRLPSAMLDVR